jgi:DNA-binding transcriptional MerR regulator
MYIQNPDGTVTVIMYGTRELCEATGVTPKQVRQWVATKKIAPAWYTERGAYLWRVEDFTRVEAVRDQQLARLDRLRRKAGGK